MAVVTMRQLLECGVHFGHQTKRWCPKMRKYIFTSRNDIHVIDLQQTVKLINVAYNVLRDTVAAGGTVLFVGTKKQAQEAIQQEAERSGMPYVNQRWLGGLLTNITTIRNSVNKMKKLERMIEDGSISQFSKKEASRKIKLAARLKHYLQGVRDMHSVPTIVFVVDTSKETLAVSEARKLGIPVIGIVDTNADPSHITYPIPANDDAIRAIKLLCSVISNAVVEGKEIYDRKRVEGTLKDVEAAMLDQEVAEEIEVPSETELAEIAVEIDEEDGQVARSAAKSPAKAVVKGA